MNNYLALIFYIFSISLIFLILLKDRRIGIFYYFPLLPMVFLFKKIQIFPIGKDIIDIMLFAIILGWFLQDRKFIKTDINRPIYIFIIYTFLELLNGYIYLGEGFNIGDVRMQMWKNFMLMPLLFFIVLNNIKRLDEIKKLIFNISFIYLTIGIKFIRNFTDIGYFDWALKQDFSAVFVYLSANYVAAFMVQYMIIFLCLFYYFKEKNLGIRLYYLIISGLGIYNVLFLFSRGAYLASVVVMFILGVLRDRKILIVLIMLFIFWHIILPNSVFQRINMTLHTEDEVKGVYVGVGREKLWEHAIELFKEKPIFGTGYKTFAYTVPQDLKASFKEHIGKAITDTHSLYFNVLAEMGIVGLGLLLYLLFLQAKSGWRLFRLARDGFLKGLGLGFFLCVIACMITSIFGDKWSLFETQNYYWIFWALTERGLIITREQIRTNTESK